MTSSSTRIAVLLFLSSSLAVAQTHGGSTGGGTSSGGGTKGTGTTTTTTVPTRGNSNIPPVMDQTRPITLTGRVVMDDGTPPSEKVSIERICNGRARREAYSDSHGYFSFIIDNSRPQMVMQDASVGYDGLDSMRPSGMRSSSSIPDVSGTRTLDGCELKAVMGGAVSESIQLTGRRAFDDPNVGTIVLHRMGKTTGGATVSLTSLKAPDKAKKAFEDGKKALAKEKQAEAQAKFTKAVEIFPDFAEAWVELADIYMKSHDVENARAASEHAVAADPRYVRPYFTLIVLAASQENWKQTLDVSDKLVALDAYNYPAAYYYNALANYKLRNLEKADASIKAARKLDTANKLPKISLLMAAIMMDRNDFAGAVQEYRAFLNHATASAADAEYARRQLADAQTKLAAAPPPPPAGSPK